MCGRRVHGAEQVALVEKGDDFVARLEAGNARANLDDLAGTVGTGGYWGLDWERVEALLCLGVFKMSWIEFNMENCEWRKDINGNLPGE
jgi:hypothetical protein